MVTSIKLAAFISSEVLNRQKKIHKKNETIELDEDDEFEDGTQQESSAGGTPHTCQTCSLSALFWLLRQAFISS